MVKSMGKIELTSFFSNGMILQRETENCIWGYAESGRTIRIFLGAYQAAAKIEEDGYFECFLPKMKAGGPWEILLSDGDETIRIKDVWFGDVFLLGGQSNMELPVERVMERFGEEIRTVNEEHIRMFEVPKEYAFVRKREMLTGGTWIKAKGEELQAFSAAGFFVAKALREKENVPIGLYQTAVGGTPLKAWTSGETIRKLGLDAEELTECADEEYIKRTEQEEAERERVWWEAALHPFEEEDAEKAVPDGKRRRGQITVPEFFEDNELSHFIGSLRLRKSIVLSDTDIELIKEKKETAPKLYFGTVIDADKIYVNGVKIGETAYKYPPRIYPIPEGVLHAGENEIEVRMLVFRGEGGTTPGKEYKIQCGEMKLVDLSGTWEYEVVKDMKYISGYLPETTFFSYKASGLYNGMLYPIRKCRVSGCFFYQGESNTGRPETYEEEFTQMIGDWRILFENPSLPFLYVQLAGFADGREHTEGTEWAKLREAQKKTEKLANTGMVQAYDLGEYNDLHPLDKKNVGERLALAAEALVYGKETVWKGPEAEKFLWEKTGVTVLFSMQNEKLALCVKDKYETKENTLVEGFVLETEDGKKVLVPARITGKNCVFIELPEKETVKSISFAWNDCPLEANLYHTEGLPAVPFRVCAADLMKVPAGQADGSKYAVI